MGDITTAPDFAALLGAIGTLPSVGPLDLSAFGFGSVTGSYELEVELGSAVSLLTDPITGSGGVRLDFAFADTAGGDLEVLVADQAFETGTLAARLFADVVIHADALPAPAPVPLPAGLTLLPAGLIGLALVRRRNRKAA